MAWHRKDIVAEIGKRDTNLVQLALAHNLSRSALHYALLRPSKRAEDVIASFLGIPPQNLWPDRYDTKGTRTVKRGRHPRRPLNGNIPARRRTRGQ